MDLEAPANGLKRAPGKPSDSRFDCNRKEISILDLADVNMLIEPLTFSRF